MKTYTKQNIEQVIWGGALLGSGGGGGLDLALNFLAEIPSDATVLIADQADANAPGAVFAFVGAPDALSTLSAQPLYDAFERMNAINPVRILVPVEIGAVNSIAPILLALRFGLPVANCDGAGRAVPALTNLTYSNVVPVSPIILTNGEGVAADIDVADAATAEALVRSVVTAPQFGQVGGLGLWYMTASQLQTVPIWNTMEQSRAIGEVILSNVDVETISFALGNIGRTSRIVATGKFSAGQEITGGGFDTGRTTITQADGQVFTIYNQNESLTAWSNKAASAAIVAPDSACYWNNDTNRPFSNGDLKANDGANVSLIEVLALSKLLNSQSAILGFENTLAALGYAGAVPGAPAEKA